MKRTFATICAVFLLLIGNGAFLPRPVTAQTPSYLRVVKEGVVLYRTPVSHYDFALFLLPNSYYLRTVEKEGSYYLVEYQDGEEGFPKIYGYVECAALSDEYQTPSAPLFPKEVLTVIKSTYVYTQASENADLLATALDGQTVRLYGKFYSKNGERLFYYVRFGQVMGYLPAENCTAPSGEPHPDAILTPSVDLPVQGELNPAPSQGIPVTVSPSQRDVLQIVLVIAVTLSILVIVYAMFRPKRPTPRFFEDEEE